MKSGLFRSLLPSLPILAAGIAVGQSMLFDFEDGDLGGWMVVAGDFPSPVCRYESWKKGGGLKGPRQGDWFLTTAGIAAGIEGPTEDCMGGVIESPVFVVEGKEAKFLFGGTGGRLALCSLDGKQQQEISFHQRDGLKANRWNLSKVQGKQVFLRLTDKSERPSCYASLDAFEVEGRIDGEATRKRRVMLAEENRRKVAPALKALEEVGEIVFAVREPGKNGHYYVNFGNWSGNPHKWEYGRGGRLCRLDVRSGKLRTLIDDPPGAVRDPQLHYDGKKILFSYRPGKTHRFHLYEINIDGSGLRQLTDGPFDDIEPVYQPDGRIIFSSTRCNRIINCNLVQAALLHTCDGDGSRIRQISPNNETENTPWPMPDGRVMYTRWEYVDRGIGGFKALWTTNPDGTGQAAIYGNMNAAPTYLDAKPIPGSGRIVMVNSQHMGREHIGSLAVMDPRKGPDDRAYEETVSWEGDCRDPYPVGTEGFLVARESKVLLIGADRSTHTVFELPEKDREAGLWCHEPRLLKPRKREPVIPSRLDLGKATGTLVLADVHKGRNMEGVEPGEIKELLVMETLPKAVNFSGRADPYSFDHSFNLNRVLGTVPVEEDGSACLELPAMRGIVLAALDKDGMAVKRMQSFLTVQPGETMSCVGCHEQRTHTPLPTQVDLLALRREPSKIKAFDGVPGVFDFPRDLQPILDRHCLACHDYEATEKGGPRDGGVILAGDHGPVFSHSFAALHMGDLVVVSRDGKGNRPPRGFGSGASPLMGLIDGSHYDAKLSEKERLMVRLWIDASATYAGTCAASGTGKFRDKPKLSSLPAAAEVLEQRCASCHAGERRLPKHPGDTVGVGGYAIVKEELPRKFSNHVVWNLTRPRKSLMLLAPLAAEAGGYGVCAEKGKPVFEDRGDPDFQALADLAEECRELHLKDKRFDMTGFRPSDHYVRMMKEYGIIPRNFDAEKRRLDPYEIDEKYWRSFWHVPERKNAN